MLPAFRAAAAQLDLHKTSTPMQHHRRLEEALRLLPEGPARALRWSASPRCLRSSSALWTACCRPSRRLHQSLLPRSSHRLLRLRAQRQRRVRPRPASKRRRLRHSHMLAWDSSTCRPTG